MVLSRLLKELWNYWLSPATVSEVRVSTDPQGSWKARTELGWPAVREAHCWVLRQHAEGLNPLGTFVSGVVFENCRVDASIFVVKLLRAHGGCLGFRSR